MSDLPGAAGADDRDFETFAVDLRPRLVRALVPVRGIDGAADAASEALAYAWEHWGEVGVMNNAAGFLYRVAQSRSRTRKRPHLPPTATIGLPDLEPGLVPAMLELRSHNAPLSGWSMPAAGRTPRRQLPWRPVPPRSVRISCGAWPRFDAPSE